jgi:hypothetical protein
VFVFSCFGVFIFCIYECVSLYFVFLCFFVVVVALFVYISDISAKMLSTYTQ